MTDNNNENQTTYSICNPKYVTTDLLKLPNNVSIVCDDGEVPANMELLAVRSDFFARGFTNPGFIESQEKRLRMAGCSKAAMEAVKAYLYTGEMDFRKLRLDTLLYVMNVSREILIEEELFIGIETFIKTIKIKSISAVVQGWCGILVFDKYTHLASF